MERTDRLALVAALALGAGLRSIQLMGLFPVLVDEAIYLRWAQIIAQTHTWFISLLDAKPPLAYWMYAAMRVGFRNNPLFGNRLISVAAGVLCIWVLYRIGAICGGPRAGAIAALLYSVLPYGVFYDRIAYVDSLVNVCGALLVWASLRAFGGKQITWRGAALVGLTLGLGMFVKTTVLLLAPTPVVIGAFVWKGSRRRLAAHLAAAYGIALVFPMICRFAAPPGPTFDVNSVLFHHTSFFTPLNVLARDPLVNLRINAPLLLGYCAHYVTYPVLIAAGAATTLLWRRNRLVVAILLACILPFVLPLTMLEYFPSRYFFPVVWPLLLAIGCAAAIPKAGWSRAVAYAIVATVFGAAALQSGRIIRAPDRALHESDAEEFLGPGPYSGAGVLEAIGYLKAEARGEPITVLTDPWWGPPTDVVFAYLEHLDGIRVYEAWWLQRKREYPLVPIGEMPVWRSQYQRVFAGEVDFSALPRLYYVTDTNYNTPEDVRAMSPVASLVKRYPKRSGHESVDVYRLR